MAPVNRMLDECAEHLAREHAAQASRTGVRMNVLSRYTWDDLLAEEQALGIATMRALLYRGVIICPRPEHRIQVSLRAEHDEGLVP